MDWFDSHSFDGLLPILFDEFRLVFEFCCACDACNSAVLFLLLLNYWMLLMKLCLLPGKSLTVG